MVQSASTTVADYVAGLPAEKARVIRKVRAAMRKAMPKGFVESMTWGMPTFEVPLKTYPDTYNKKPLMYAAFAAQKNHYGIYLTAPYQDAKVQKRLEAGFAAAGKKLDMGKSCVRFKDLDDVPLDVISEIIGAHSVEDFIGQYEAARAGALKGGKAARSKGRSKS